MSNVIIKNKVAIRKMRHAGKQLAAVMNFVSQYVISGISTLEINDLIEKKMRELELRPECKGYAGYKHASCISLNDVVVHGVPSKETILKSGDFVKIDVVGSYQGYCTDMARYFFVGDASAEAKRLAIVAKDALDIAISMVKPGVYLSDVSFAIQNKVEKEGFGVVRDFAGHGIGKNIHEAPDVPNYGNPGTGPKLVSGMTLAIEPMITQYDYAVKIMDDGWTAKTVDGGLAAHIEDTVLVTDSGSEVLTRA